MKKAGCVLVLVALLRPPAVAQNVDRGGEPGSCLWPMTLMFEPGGDDTLWPLENRIKTGDDGICQTRATVDDYGVLQDVQEIDYDVDHPRGKPNCICVTIDTGPLPQPGGDDEAAPGGEAITTGPNGICETAAGPSNVQNIPVGQGSPNEVCVLPGMDQVLGWHLEPAALMNVFGELASIEGLHDGIDVTFPSTLADWQRWRIFGIAPRGGQQLDVMDRPVSNGRYSQAVVFVSDTQEEYLTDVLLHVQWAPYFRGVEGQSYPDYTEYQYFGAVSAGTIVGRGVAMSDAHVHWTVERRSRAGHGELDWFYNPLYLLRVPPRYAADNPQVTLDQGKPQLWVGLAQADALPPEADSRTVYRFKGASLRTVMGLDIIVGIVSQSDPAPPPAPWEIPIQPYAMNVALLGGPGGGYNNTWTVYRWDRIDHPWDNGPLVRERLYASESVPYERFVVVATNCGQLPEALPEGGGSQAGYYSSGMMWQFFDSNGNLLPGLGQGAYDVGVQFADCLGRPYAAHAAVEVDLRDLVADQPKLPDKPRDP